MIIEVEKSYYKYFYQYLRTVNEELNIVQEVDTYIYDMMEVVNRFQKKVTRDFLKQNVLPVIAIYKALLEQVEQAEAIRLIDEYLAKMIVKDAKRYQKHGAWSRFFGTYRNVLFRQMNRRKEGWKITWLYHSKKETACNVQECLIATILKEFDCFVLTPVICKYEHCIMQKLHKKGHFSCDHTIGRGDEFCDFVFEEKL